MAAPTINHSVLVAYFKYLADNLIGVNDFFRMNLMEIQGAFRSTAKFPCLVIEAHDGDYSGSNVMQSVNDRTFAFTVYAKPKKDDFDDQDTQLTLSEILGKKILARMRHDATLSSHFLYNHFKASNVSYSKVGPIFNEKLYGYRFVGSITAPEPLIVNPADWEDSPVICE